MGWDGKQIPLKVAGVVSVCWSCSFFSCFEKCVWLWCMEKHSWCLSSFLLVSSWHTVFNPFKKSSLGIAEHKDAALGQKFQAVGSTHRDPCVSVLCLCSSLGPMRSQDSLLDGPWPNPWVSYVFSNFVYVRDKLKPFTVTFVCLLCLLCFLNMKVPTVFKISHYFVYAYETLHQCFCKY